MATATSAYQEQFRSSSGKWPRDLNPWFQACDLPDHLRVTILVMLTKNRHGLELWMSITRLAVELGVCRRTAQRRVRRLEELKVLKQTIKPNTYVRPDHFRPSATYQANPCAVKERPNWKDFEDKRATERRLLVKSATQHRRCRMSSSSSLEAAPVAAFSGAPSSTQAEYPGRLLRPQHHAAERRSVEQGSAEHRSAEERPPKPKLSKTEAAKFVADMVALMKGRTRHVEAIGGYSYELHPGDARYAAPMGWREALAAVAKRWNRTEESVMDALMLWGYRIETENGDS